MQDLLLAVRRVDRNLVVALVLADLDDDLSSSVEEIDDLRVELIDLLPQAVDFIHGHTLHYPALSESPESEALERRIRSDPTDADALLRLAEIYQAEKKPERAINVYLLAADRYALMS